MPDRVRVQLEGGASGPLMEEFARVVALREELGLRDPQGLPARIWRRLVVALRGQDQTARDNPLILAHE